MTQALKRFHVADRMSEMAVFHQTVFLAGQVASDATQDIRGQTRQVLVPIESDAACAARYQQTGASGTPTLLVHGERQLGFSAVAVAQVLQGPQR